MFTVYILRTSIGSLYIGQTNDLEKRLATHRSGKGAKYLRLGGEFKLVYAEKHPTRSSAMAREYELKKLSKRAKELLVSNP